MGHRAGGVTELYEILESALHHQHQIRDHHLEERCSSLQQSFRGLQNQCKDAFTIRLFMLFFPLIYHLSRCTEKSTVTHFAFTVQEKFSSFPQCTSIKHVVDRLSLSLSSTGGTSGHRATLWCFITVAFYHQSVWCFPQVAELTDSRINLPIKDHRCAGSRAPVGRKAKQTWMRNEHWINTKIHSLLNIGWTKYELEVRNQGHTSLSILSSLSWIMCLFCQKENLQM